MADTCAIFLSYASEDAGAAQQIAGALRDAGMTVWFDKDELRGGDAWDASIRTRIKQCSLFVPIVSANTNSRSEGYFRLEWKLAVDRTYHMADDQAFLLPVLVDQTSEPGARVPDRFRERQWSRVTDADSARVFARRVADLAAGRAAADPARAGTGPAVAPPTAPAAPAPVRRPRWRLAAALALLMAMAAGAWVAIDRNHRATLVAQGLRKVESLARGGDTFGAFAAGREVEAAGGADALTDAVRDEYSTRTDIQSVPPGATIAVRRYRGAGDEAWIELGRTPLAQIRLPQDPQELRATLEGYAPSRRVHLYGRKIVFTLVAVDAKDASMVPVNGGRMDRSRLGNVLLEPKIALAPYLIDRTELSNREYAQFVRAGGYARPEFWTEAFRDGGRTLSFAQATARFKDATGRPGPATWRLGSYPEGEDDQPVRGVSWFEAAAYARFAGKELPTLYHWYFADNGGDFFELEPLLFSAANFRGNGPWAASKGDAIGAFGALNMAGNVREWVANETDRRHRLTVGGSWTDVEYMYADPDVRSPWDRPADAGFRCMKRPGGDAAADAAGASLHELGRADAFGLQAVGDAEYAIYERLYEPRKVALDVRVEASGTAPADWSVSKVSYAADYGGERAPALLFLPRQARPPFQTIVFMPGSYAFAQKRPLDDQDVMRGLSLPKLLVMGGRAVLYPVWKGSYERSDNMEWSVGYLREHAPEWVGDLRQSVEFLRSRQDIDPDRIGFLGESFGAAWGPLLLALEPRVRTGILDSGGLLGPLQLRTRLPPEINPATFAPHVRVPMLMINGRDDVIFIYETSQVPLFNLLGSAPGRKLHKTYPGSHSVYGSYDQMARDTHEWLDQVFGPVAAPVPK